MPFVLIVCVICMFCVIGAFTFFTVTDISNQAEQIISSTENNNIETKTATSSEIETEDAEDTTEESCDESTKDNIIAFLICLIFILTITGSSSSGSKW